MNKILNLLYYGPKNFIHNLWAYRKFLWTDRWYDDHYLYFMMREKLRHDRGMYKKYSLNLHSQDQINSMKRCILVLDRIINDNYFDNALYFYEKEHPDWYGDITRDIPDRKWFRRCSDKASKQRQQDIDYLWSLVGKYSKSWWD